MVGYVFAVVLVEARDTESLVQFVIEDLNLELSLIDYLDDVHCGACMHHIMNESHVCYKIDDMQLLHP